jgi:hypothetical protein
MGNSENYANIRIDKDKEPNYPMIIWNGTHNVSSSVGVYYIKITSEKSESCKFSILATTRNSSTYLFGGLEHHGYLSPGESNEYKYATSADDMGKNKRLRLAINIFQDNFINPDFKLDEDNMQKFMDRFWETPRYEISAIHKAALPGSEGPSQSIDYVRRDDSKTQQSDLLKSSSHLMYDLKPGRYSFQISNPNKELPLNYSVMINQKYWYDLQLGATRLSRLVVQEEEVFVVQIQQKSTLALTIYECFGQVTLQATTSYEDFLKDQFDLVIKRGEKALVGTIDIESAATVYIKVKAVQGISDSDTDPSKEALYKIHAQLFEEGQLVPFNEILPGNEGSLTANLDPWNNWKINLKWSAIESVGSDNPNELKEYHITPVYKVIITQDPVFTESLARCDHMPDYLEGEFRNRSTYFLVKSFYTNNVTEIEERVKELDITDLNNNGTYFVSVVAHVKGARGGATEWEFPVLYQTVELNLPPRGGPFSGGTPVIVFIVSGLLALAVLAGIYYFKKYKKVRERLRFEMTDARNMANASVSDDIERERPSEAPVKERYLELLETRSNK